MSFERCALDFAHRRLPSLPSEAVALLGSNLRIRAFFVDRLSLIVTIHVALRKHNGRLPLAELFVPQRLLVPVR